MADNFFSLSSLLKSDKDILWIGGKDEVPPSLPRSLLSRIRHIPWGPDHTIEKIKHEGVTILSVRTTDFDVTTVRPLLQALTRPPILVVDQITLKSQDSFFRALSGMRFSSCLLWPEDKESLEQAIQKAERSEIKDAATGDSSAMRGLVRFIQEVSAANSIESLLRSLRQELQPFYYIKYPIIGVADSVEQWRIFFFQGNDVLERTTRNVWPQGRKIRANDTKDSQYLANILERPFAKLLTIPLLLRREVSGEALKVPAVLFLEHSIEKSQMDDFLSFVNERLQPFTIALDRVLLEADLKRASILWERTFDSLKDPIAIFDAEGQLVRGNKAYALKLTGVQKGSVTTPLFKYADRYYEPKMYPIHFEEGRHSSNIIIHFVDVTQSYKLRRQMVQNEKMAALGHLAGNIAHELNNPLTGVRSLAQILLSRAPKETPLYSDLFEVEKAAERCQIIIQNLLDFSSGGVGEKRSVVRLSHVVERTLPLLKASMRMLNVDVCLPPSDDEIFVEPHLLQQVVFNLLKNACQATPEGGEIQIDIRRQEDIEEDRRVPYVILSIKDTGMGIAPENLDQIFEYFFTTKSQEQGTGLGLGMSKSIVDRFGGKITVKSQVGKGTEFCVWLPYASSHS